VAVHCHDDVVMTVGSRLVYRNAWMSVREDAVLLDDGSPGLYGVVDKPDFALIIPRDAERLWLVEQYRYPVQRRAWEFPQGSWSAGDSGSQEDLARAELREETGLEADDISYLGHLYGAYGFCSQGFDVYLATALRPVLATREKTVQDMRYMRVTARQFVSMVRDGQVVDAATVAAYWLLNLAE
jgi:8-oxo-dGTP pyrophosphatase MutT (NUDIX family)